MITKKRFVFLIPVRMKSSRLFGKPLKLIKNKSVVERVYENCKRSQFAKKVIVATDSNEIKIFCKEKNIDCLSTGKHNCASNRIAEVAKNLREKWIVEVQGDEPFLYSKIMDNWLKDCIKLINKKKYEPDIFLSYANVKYKDASNHNFVKLLFNDTNEVVGCSRSKIPSDWKGTIKSRMYRHTGFHLWRRKSLIRFASIKPSYIEKSEDTHAVRLIINKFQVKGIKIPVTLSIDTPQDLRKANKRFN